MQDVLGVGTKETKVLHLHCFSSRIFSLDEYNERLVNFSYEYRNNTVLCSTFSKDTTIHTSAAQLLTFIRNLPSMHALISKIIIVYYNNLW